MSWRVGSGDLDAWKQGNDETAPAAVGAQDVQRYRC
jgi:hypothetical protein